jgi:tetratricopeptide repeat protein 21B
MQNFIDMLEEDQDYLPAILGMATGYMVEKNQHKARNLLKRVAKMELSTRDGEDFTKANLLLAKFYVDKVRSHASIMTIWGLICTRFIGQLVQV